MSSGRRSPRAGPSDRRAQLLRARLLESIPESTVARVADTLAEAALKGNLTAIKLLLEYAAGRPAQAREVSGPDREPPAVDWEQLRALILGALGKHPEAKIDLATNLDALSRAPASPADRQGP